MSGFSFDQPSAIAYLLLLLVLPMAVGGIIMLIGLAPAWRRSLGTPTTDAAEE